MSNDMDPNIKTAVWGVVLILIGYVGSTALIYLQLWDPLVSFFQFPVGLGCGVIIIIGMLLIIIGIINAIRDAKEG